MIKLYPKIRRSKGDDFILIFKKTAVMITEVLIAIFVIICVSALPTLFRDISVNFFAFLVEIKNTFLSLLHPLEITYGMGIQRPVFPQIFYHYKESVLLIVASLLISTILAFLLTYLILLIFQTVKSKIMWFLTIIESLPDIFYIIALQFLTIMFFKKTGTLLFNVASAGDDRAYFLPIVCLSLPLTLLLTKFLIQQFEKEQGKLYVEYAVTKGMKPLYIFNIHIFKNVLFSLYHYSKTAIWFVISNLVILEYMFNMTGIIYFIFRKSPEIFVIGILMIYLPLYLIYRICDWLIPPVVRGEAID